MHLRLGPWIIYFLLFLGHLALGTYHLCLRISALTFGDVCWIPPFYSQYAPACRILHGREPWQTSSTTSQVQPEAAPSTAFPFPPSSARHACRPAMGSLEMLHHGFATTCPVAAWSTGHPPCFARSFRELPRIERGQKKHRSQPCLLQLHQSLGFPQVASLKIKSTDSEPAFYSIHSWKCWNKRFPASWAKGTNNLDVPNMIKSNTRHHVGSSGFLHMGLQVFMNQASH